MLGLLFLASFIADGGGGGTLMFVGGGGTLPVYIFEILFFIMAFI